MATKIRLKHRKLACITASVFVLGALVSLFVCFFGFFNESGNMLHFDSFKAFFGGTQVFNLGGYSLTFNFKISIPLLIYIQVFLICVLSILISGDSVGSHVFSLVVLTLLIVSTFLTKLFLRLSNPGLTIGGLRWGGGFYVSLVCLIIAASILLSLIMLEKRLGKEISTVQKK